MLNYGSNFPKGPTIAYAGDEGYAFEITDSSRIGIKFVLRKGDS